MKKSPVFPKHENGDYNGHGLDPQLDFSQFLEEARKHAKEVKLQRSSSQRPKDAGKRVSGEEKSKKSWKNVLFPWWRVDKKDKPAMEEPSSTGTQIWKPPRRGSISGPINGSGEPAEGPPTQRIRRPNSGPLAALFTPTKRGEVEIPYACLDQLNHPNGGVQAFGPVYLVT